MPPGSRVAWIVLTCCAGVVVGRGDGQLSAQSRAAAEPAARPAKALPLRVAAPLAHVSAARELPDGRLLLTDAKSPAVWLLDQKTGERSPLGSPGAGPEQFVQPGGLYGGPEGSTLLLDRAPLRVMVISPAGAFIRTYSIAVKGVQSSSSSDVDQQRIDARGFSYFPDRGGIFGRRGADGSPVPAPLVRFDPVAQRQETIGELAQPASRSVDLGNGASIGRSVFGSPADGFGVAPDGRVAIVRGAPYRVDWISADGKLTRGPDVAHDAVPITDADKAAYVKTTGTGSAGVGVPGGDPRAAAALEPMFAATKAPFSPVDVIVSPDAQVWVMRSRPASATTVVYDVFDRTGRRVDRLEFPAGSRVVGFGAAAVFVRETGAAGMTLKKYQRPKA